MKLTSLRANLIKSLIPPLIIVMTLIGFFSIWSIYHEVDEVYDATLVEFSRTLSRSASTSAGQKDGTHIAHRYERNITYRIFKGGNLVSQSTDALTLNNIVPLSGFSDHVVNGKSWRFFTLIDEDTGYTVEVAEKYNIRHELILQLLSSLVFPGIVFVMVALAVIWRGVSQGLQRLVAVSAEVDSRKTNDLSPIPGLSVPTEIQPLLDALNRLFARISQSFVREREFTDNAAHELRTPLAAMKTQAQVILKTENLSSKGIEGFNNLLASIDHAIEMTENLLAFTRLQSDTGGRETIDLGRLVEEEYRALEKTALIKGVEIELSIEKNITLEGVPHAISILVHNIIQNAIKFTPTGGNVTVSVRKTGNTAALSVTDTGQGIPDEFKEKVFERFFRINKSGATGSGLGLALVKWIADAHQAKITLLDNHPRGVIFSVLFNN